MQRWRARGTGFPHVEAKILAQEAILQRDQRRLDEVVALFERVEAILHARERAGGVGQLEGMSGDEVLQQQAWCLHHLGRPVDAAVLGQATVPVLVGRAGARLRLPAGDREAAKRQLEEAARGLVRQQFGIEAGLAWLDLAGVLLGETTG